MSSGTYGFDAASPQARLRFPEVGSSERFCFVKATGANVGLYVAPHYAAEHDAARLEGLHLGHTHLTGLAASVEDQAAYFVRNLRGFDEVHDALALDNERFPEEPGSVMWSDGQVARFWGAVFRLLPKFPRHHAFTYGDQAHLTALAPWDKTNALGTRWWVAGYGPDDGQRHALPHVPGCAVAIHQYTSKGRLGGVQVDLDWSPFGLEELFGRASGPAVVAKQQLAKAQAETTRSRHVVLGKTTTSFTGSPGDPGSLCWMRMQLLARLGGYAGVIDGHLQVNSWKGVQRYLAGHYGYTGAIDGDPQELTFKALQRLAAHHGYTGPIDGDLQRESWRHLAGFLNTLT